MNSLREILEQNEHEKAQKRGSVFVTLLIIAIFTAGALFYVRTAKPQLFDAAITCVKGLITNAGQKEDGQEAEQDTERAPYGTILRSAQTLDFRYLSTELEARLFADDFAVLPLKNATVTSDFGARIDPVTKKTGAYHHGIDLAAPKNSGILSFRDGIVQKTDNDPVYGNCVLISHSDCQSFYAHLSKINVKAGEKVKAGDGIGVIGSTGKSTGIHLHFEIRKEGVCVDPAEYLYEKI